MKRIRISSIGTPSDYRLSLIPIILQSLGYRIDWVKPSQADLLILGPFANPLIKEMRWCPKPLRPLFKPVNDALKSALTQVQNKPLTLFHTAENYRHDFWAADYSISFDLAVSSSAHFRLPYWMEMIDWSHEGVTGNENPRYGSLLNIERLMQPLGRTYQEKNWRALFLSSHLREPRKTLLQVLKRHMSVECRGPFFDLGIQNHHQSGFLKKELLKNFAVNLCPENGLYPGYYSEKIPEAFYADCLPISWTDSNVSVDFNPDAFINLAPLTSSNFEELSAIVESAKNSEKYASQHLLKVSPSILPFQEFIKRMIQDALS
jgi:hypothetical protein